MFAAALVIGVYDGFYGPGTGTFLILIFCSLAKMDLRTAAGNVKLINLSSNVGAVVTYQDFAVECSTSWKCETSASGVTITPSTGSGNGTVRVTFGAQNGLIYTSAAGSVLTRPRYVCVLVAPTVLLSLAILGACLAAGAPLLGWCLFALHLSGCAGDLIMAARIATERGCTHVRDTDYGCELLRAAGEPR